MYGCRKILNLFLPGLIVLMCLRLGAQEDALERAKTLYSAKKFEQALPVIDSVVRHPQTHTDFESWTLRAFIYNEIYKKSDRLKLYSPLRDTVVSSLRTALQLKPDSQMLKYSLSLISNIAKGYFNLGKSLLVDSLNYERSRQAYLKYKELYVISEPEHNFQTNDVEYYLAAGSLFADAFNSDNNNTKAFETAKVGLLTVLDIQPDNPSANINMGLMYYNQAVNLSKSLDYGADLSQIDFVQDNMVKLARQAEQFIIRVYNNDQNHKKAAEALYYIYRMLSEFEKSELFKAKCTELGINVEPSNSGK